MATSTRSSLHPRIFVALTTVPGRRQRLIEALHSLRRQRFRPERILISAANTFTRPELASGAVDLSELVPAGQQHSQSLTDVEVLRCERDDGPGTKLLCALSRLRELAAHAELARGPAPTFVAVVDDDLRYNPWVLELLAQAVRNDTELGGGHGGARHSYSYDVYTLTRDGRAVTGGMCPATSCPLPFALCMYDLSVSSHLCMHALTPAPAHSFDRCPTCGIGMYPGLLVGSGHSLFAFRLSSLDGIEDFFSCLRGLEPRVSWHDDVWLSMFVQDRLRVPVCWGGLRVCGSAGLRV